MANEITNVTSAVQSDVAKAEAAVKADVAKVQAVESGLSRTQLFWVGALVGVIVGAIARSLL